HEVNDYNIDSASTSFVLASSVTDLDTVSINSSTTNETANRAIIQTYSETSSQLASLKCTSTVWNSFSKVTNEKNEEKAQCNYCNKLLSHKKGCGTSHLQHHFDACLKYQRFLYHTGSKPTQ
ncbi:7940_t:CDS:1, partial [Racocetra persica]